MSDERLPFGKQISPNQINLRQALGLVRDNPRNREALHRAIGDTFFTDRDDRRTFGMNAFLAMRSYGLVTGDKEYALTALGEDLLKTQGETAFHERLGQHILLNLHGLQVVEAVHSLQSRGVNVKVETVAQELTTVGIGSGGDSGENINPLRLLLERAGVFIAGKGLWTIDSAVVKKLTGASTAEISEIVDLTKPQQAFLRALATYTDEESPMASKVRSLAEGQAPAIRFDTKTFAERVVKSLAEDGWIEVEKATGGRGAKSSRVTPTEKFRKTISEPLMNTVLEQTHFPDPASLRRPLRDLLTVVNDVKNETNHARGLALEGVCIQVIRMIGARFLDWRLRGKETSGAEVDLVAETSNDPYLLIQLQSKASAINGREIIDREVGVAQSLKSNVILFVSAKNVGKAARRAAAVYMQETSLAVLFLDETDLSGGAAAVAAGIAREWDHVRQIKGKRGQERTRAMTE
ncbi:hypothetical protein [Arthrobacter humicola]|uniref:hypothetical protein n=1 Tax=Arthrobacter humicola TaxID=409291 RepID=UPI001FABF696|nr:hypothetical protein [Arthrobacter humicola]MCI9872785.1 hypothetical protein [Arthrobacter humicola]